MIKRRIDLFGCFDQLVIKPGQVYGIQTTTNSNVSSHVAKLLASKDFHKWIEFGCKAAICAWSKRGTRGQRKTWQCKELIYNPIIGGFVDV